MAINIVYNTNIMKNILIWILKKLFGKKDIICWWSGGITSAVACKLAVNLYGKEDAELYFKTPSTKVTTRTDSKRIVKNGTVLKSKLSQLLEAI